MMTGEKRIAHYFSPLYDFARRHLDISPAVLERALIAEGEATVSGRDVQIHYRINGGQLQVISGYLKWPTRRSKLTRWARRFNERSLRGDVK